MRTYYYTRTFEAYAYTALLPDRSKKAVYSTTPKAYPTHSSERSVGVVYKSATTFNRHYKAVVSKEDMTRGASLSIDKTLTHVASSSSLILDSTLWTAAHPNADSSLWQLNSHDSLSWPATCRQLTPALPALFNMSHPETSRNSHPGRQLLQSFPSSMVPLHGADTHY